MLPQALASQTCTTFKALSWSVLLRCPTHPGGVSQESLTCPVQPWPKPLWWWSVLSRRASCTLASGNSATSQIKENLEFATNKQVFFSFYVSVMLSRPACVKMCVCESRFPDANSQRVEWELSQSVWALQPDNWLLLWWPFQSVKITSRVSLV